jgi:outer membrane biosynthesis protein TonB
MVATRRSASAKGTKVTLDTVLLATAVGAGVAAYHFLDAAPEVVVTSCCAAVGVILIYGGKVQTYVKGRKPKAPKSPKRTRVQPKRSATPEPLSRKKPAKKAPKPKRAASPAPKAARPARKAAVAPKKPAARKPAAKSKAGSRATLEALASARSTPATRAELKTTLETLAVDFKSSDSTKYLQRKLETWLGEN